MFDWKYSPWARVIWTVLRVYLGYNWLMSGYGKVFGENSAVWVGSKAGVAVTGFLKGALGKTSGPHPDVQSWYA
ncbi:MAG: Crp/Fnr family transcriptional regulator, partial [Syntrophomonas sp.]